MAGGTRRPAVKTVTLVKSRDFVVDKLLKSCEDDNHSRCTGWAVLRKEASGVNANYFLRCTCACHKKHSNIGHKTMQIRRVKKKTKSKVSLKSKKKRTKRTKSKARKTRRTRGKARKTKRRKSR